MCYNITLYKFHLWKGLWILWNDSFILKRLKLVWFWTKILSTQQSTVFFNQLIFSAYRIPRYNLLQETPKLFVFLPLDLLITSSITSALYLYVFNLIIFFMWCGNKVWMNHDLWADLRKWSISIINVRKCAYNVERQQIDV